MLSLEQLQFAIAAAKRRYDLLGRKHPSLRAKLQQGESATYLVMSLPSGQIGINCSPLQMLDGFPAMIVDDSTKTNALNLLPMKTKRLGIVEELKEKHKARLARAQQELRSRMTKPGIRSDSHVSDVLLFSKWAYRVGKGWYGFSLGDVPRVWTDVLDEFLCWLETQCPDFEIHQIKIKFRSLRFYVGTKTDFVIPDEKIRSEISRLQKLLSLPQVPQTPIRAARKIQKKGYHKP